jgi:hypothetical protein
MGQVFAYARVSTDAQDLDPQTESLRPAGKSFFRLLAAFRDVPELFVCNWGVERTKEICLEGALERYACQHVEYGRKTRNPRFI